MRQQLKKYGSLFLLLLFLFPLVEKQVHILDHLNDTRCVATDKHFHEMEHACPICEFTVTDSCIVPTVQLTVILSEQTYFFKVATENIHTPEAFQDLPSRAPPVC